MGSGYFGEPNMGSDNHHHERVGSGGSSSRKGKKGSNGSNSEKPKQPQRGLGVAQLEKIRLTGQLSAAAASFHHNVAYPSPPNLGYQEDIRGHSAGYSSSSSSIPSSSFSYSSSSSSLPSYGYNPNIMMGVGDYERRNNIRYGDHSQPISWNMGNTMYESHQHSFQQGSTNHLFNLHETTSKSKKHRSDSIGSSSQNSESSDCQELDLELRLSL